MSKNLTASDRKALIRLASSLPAGSPERRAILAGLQKGASTRGDVNVPGKHILERAEVTDNAKVSDKAVVSGNAEVGDNAKVSGRAQVGGNAVVYRNARIGGKAVILGGEWDGSEGEITKGVWKSPTKRVR